MFYRENGQFKTELHAADQPDLPDPRRTASRSLADLLALPCLAMPLLASDYLLSRHPDPVPDLLAGGDRR